MNKIMDNGVIRDMTFEEQAQFDADQAATPVVEQKSSAEELLARLEVLQKELNAIREQS